MEDNKYCKVREYSGATRSICNLKYSIPEKIHIAFHNEYDYDYHFIIKKLAEKFRKTVYFFRRKHWQIYNPYSSNGKISYKNW